MIAKSALLVLALATAALAAPPAGAEELSRRAATSPNEVDSPLLEVRCKTDNSRRHLFTTPSFTLLTLGQTASLIMAAAPTTAARPAALSASRRNSVVMGAIPMTNSLCI